MPVLLVLRHAQAISPAGTSDHDRPLDVRGRRQAAWAGAHINARGLAPQLALCSSAVRARQTLDRLADALSPRPQVRHDQALYLAEVGTLLERVRAAPLAVDRLLVVGHNPGVSGLALAVAHEPATERLGALATAALAVVAFDGPWTALGPGTAVLTDLAHPPHGL